MLEVWFSTNNGLFTYTPLIILSIIGISLMIKNKTNYNIAVIEDNQGDFILIKDYLEEQIESPLIHQIKNFKEAEQILTNKNFDVILLDLTLPDNGGQKLITEILKIAGDCPVIILTGYGDIEFSIKSLSLGVADYLFVKNDFDKHTLFFCLIYWSGHLPTKEFLSDQFQFPGCC